MAKVAQAPLVNVVEAFMNQRKSPIKESPSQALDVPFQHVGCMLCGKDDPVEAGETAWRGYRLAYGLCSHCGLKYMNPRPTRAWYLAFYEQEFWQHKFSHRSWRSPQSPFDWFRRLWKGGNAGRLSKWKKRAQLMVPEILARVKLDRTAKVLDVGCSFGLILGEIRNFSGARVFGIEPNTEARKVAEQTAAVTFLGSAAEDLVDLRDHDATFDLIIFSNSLENVVDPKPVLEACRRLLRDSGVLYVDTPNGYYYDSMNPYHPFIYTPATLQHLLAGGGLEVFDSLHEPAAMDESDVGKPFTGKRPRFLTVFARRGKVTRKPPPQADSALILKRMELSLKRLAARL